MDRRRFLIGAGRLLAAVAAGEAIWAALPDRQMSVATAPAPKTYSLAPEPVRVISVNSRDMLTVEQDGRYLAMVAINDPSGDLVKRGKLTLQGLAENGDWHDLAAQILKRMVEQSPIFDEMPMYKIDFNQYRYVREVWTESGLPQVTWRQLHTPESE
jgi:hypothetical protein